MNEGVALQFTHNLETICCYKCGILFAVPSRQRRIWVNNGDDFYCPNGHRQHYTESTVQKLKKQLAHKQKVIEWREQDIRIHKNNNNNLKNTLRAEKGAKTRLKKRIANGVCPCCHRTFKQLVAHMKNKHPKYQEK